MSFYCSMMLQTTCTENMYANQKFNIKSSWAIPVWIILLIPSWTNVARSITSKLAWVLCTLKWKLQIKTKLQDFSCDCLIIFRRSLQSVIWLKEWINYSGVRIISTKNTRKKLCDLSGMCEFSIHWSRWEIIQLCKLNRMSKLSRGYIIRALLFFELHSLKWFKS